MPYDMIRTLAKTAALVHENFIDKTKLTKYTGIAHAAVMIEKIRISTQIEANKTKNNEHYETFIIILSSVRISLITL